MPMVMLGSDLRIRRFTPAAARVLNLVPGDVGRPIGDIRLAFDVARPGSAGRGGHRHGPAGGAGGPGPRRPLARAARSTLTGRRTTGSTAPWWYCSTSTRSSVPKRPCRERAPLPGGLRPAVPVHGDPRPGRQGVRGERHLLAGDGLPAGSGRGAPVLGDAVVRAVPGRPRNAGGAGSPRCSAAAGPVTGEVEYARADGASRVASFAITGLKDDAGGVAGVVAQGEDITEHKRAEEALRESEGGSVARSRTRPSASPTSDAATAASCASTRSSATSSVTPARRCSRGPPGPHPPRGPRRQYRAFAALRGANCPVTR